MAGDTVEYVGEVKESAAHVGGRLLGIGVEMFFSTWSFMVLMMKFALLGVPTV